MAGQGAATAGSAAGYSGGGDTGLLAAVGPLSASGATADAHGGQRPWFLPGNLVLSGSYYTGQADLFTPGVTELPPGCTGSGCTAAVADGSYPYVFNNDASDPSFGITSPVFLDQITPDGRLVNVLRVPDGNGPGGTRADHVVTSFSSKSELALNLSTDGRDLTFMGYYATPNTVDASNANTPGAIDPTNPVTSAYYRVAAEVNESGRISYTLTNAYSGDNGRATLGGRLGRHDDPAHATPGKGGDHRQDAGHPAQLAAQRQLPDQGPRAIGPGLLRAEQDRHRDRHIKRGARLALIGRGKVDRDPARREDQPAVADRTADPLAGLLERGVGQPDDREAGQARSDVDLDPDDPAVDPLEGGRKDASQHRRRLGRAAHPAITAAHPRLAEDLGDLPEVLVGMHQAAQEARRRVAHGTPGVDEDHVEMGCIGPGVERRQEHPLAFVEPLPAVSDCGHRRPGHFPAGPAMGLDAAGQLRGQEGSFLGARGEVDDDVAGGPGQVLLGRIGGERISRLGVIGHEGHVRVEGVGEQGPELRHEGSCLSGQGGGSHPPAQVDQLELAVPNRAEVDGAGRSCRRPIDLHLALLSCPMPKTGNASTVVPRRPDVKQERAPRGDDRPTRPIRASGARLGPHSSLIRIQEFVMHRKLVSLLALCAIVLAACSGGPGRPPCRPTPRPS